MAKKKIGITVKGMLDIESNKFHEFDKVEGEMVHDLSDLLRIFNGLDDVTLTVNYNEDILPSN